MSACPKYCAIFGAKNKITGGRVSLQGVYDLLVEIRLI